MNQENLLLLKELLPTLSLDDILHAYSAYMVASCIGWVLVMMFTVWTGMVAYKVADTDEEGKSMVSACAGLGGFFMSLMVLDSSIKAIFPLGALLSGLVN
jgi:hypothetical protein